MKRMTEMNNWSLSKLLCSLHDEIERRLEAARQAFSHPDTKGDASEHVWARIIPNIFTAALQG